MAIWFLSWLKKKLFFSMLHTRFVVCRNIRGGWYIFLVVLCLLILFWFIHSFIHRLSFLSLSLWCTENFSCIEFPYHFFPFRFLSSHTVFVFRKFIIKFAFTRCSRFYFFSLPLFFIMRKNQLFFSTLSHKSFTSMSTVILLFSRHNEQ